MQKPTDPPSLRPDTHCTTGAVGASPSTAPRFLLNKNCVGNEEREAKQSSKIRLASIVMRVRVSRLLYLTTIAVAMVAWLWMLFEGIEWAIY